MTANRVQWRTKIGANFTDYLIFSFGIETSFIVSMDKYCLFGPWDEQPTSKSQDSLLHEDSSRDEEPLDPPTRKLQSPQKGAFSVHLNYQEMLTALKKYLVSSPHISSEKDWFFISFRLNLLEEPEVVKPQFVVVPLLEGIQLLIGTQQSIRQKTLTELSAAYMAIVVAVGKQTQHHLNKLTDEWTDFRCLPWTLDNEGNNFVSKEIYCIEMSRLGTYGTTCELEAAGQLYPRRFGVYQSGQLLVGFGEPGKGVRRLRFTGDLSGGHFDVYQAIEVLPYFSQFSPYQPDTPSLQCPGNIPKKQDRKKHRARNPPMSSFLDIRVIVLELWPEKNPPLGNLLLEFLESALTEVSEAESVMDMRK
uniref:Uncharacterized protein n=1 Tax=Timema genevievae TaxID=629358 RepID=A0A7R9K6G5_TIMGE|nr:unnamed protein product [Timema genevievae]